jgi:heme-degrading monooxygenase HmoA
MMGGGPRLLKSTKGLLFFKLLGTGKKGFSVLPDWSEYAFLAVWESEDDAGLFFKDSSFINEYKQRCAKIINYDLRCIKVNGTWDGKTPFAAMKHLTVSEHDQIGVITRASVKWHKHFRFWNYVPTSHQDLWDNPGLLFTKGIGDIPLLEMATFSLWKNQEAIMQFAYKNEHHKKAIALTKKYNWYSEELFARFVVKELRF